MFSSKDIQKAIKEQMKGKVPDLNRIKRERLEEENRGRLQCEWVKDEEGRPYYGVYLKDMYNCTHCVYGFYDISSQKSRMIQARVEQYSRVNKIFLSQMSRNFNTDGVKRIHRDFDRMFPKVNLAPDEKEPAEHKKTI